MQQTTLQTTQLGATGLEITRVGLRRVGNRRRGLGVRLGSAGDDESVAAIRRALELGVNWIDTAAAYGFGHSEQVVGRALEGLAERPYVFTKASMLPGPNRQVAHNLTRDSILREAHASLERLRVDAIDLYQIHWPIPNDDIEEGWSTFAELKEQGLVRHKLPPGAVATAWTLRNPAIDAAIVGFRRPAQVDPILLAADLALTDDDVATIEGRD